MQCTAQQMTLIKKLRAILVFCSGAWELRAADVGPHRNIILTLSASLSSIAYHKPRTYIGGIGAIWAFHEVDVITRQASFETSAVARCDLTSDQGIAAMKC